MCPRHSVTLCPSYDTNICICVIVTLFSRFRAFKSFEPHEGHPITSIHQNPTGDKFIIGTGGCQPKVFDRDGNLIITFVRGDMYIRDMTNTKVRILEQSFSVSLSDSCFHTS